MQAPEEPQDNSKYVNRFHDITSRQAEGIQKEL
jgi:hypothetical protein